MMRRFFILELLVIALISPISPQQFRFDGNQLEAENVLRKDWEILQPYSFEEMNYGSEQDCIRYEDESIEIKDCGAQNGEIKWKSADSWKVTEAIIADLNHDGKNELTMVVWRPFKPWPIDQFLPHGGRINSFQDQKGMSCHLILVGWDGEKYREFWAGSSLADPVFNIKAADMDGDGDQELIVLEGKYDTGNRSGSITLWEWSGFGFRLDDRFDGYFSNFSIITDGKNELILSS